MKSISSNSQLSSSQQGAPNAKVALILARWHNDIVDQFKQSFLQEFEARDQREVVIFEVPGAFEIPLLAKQLASTGEYAGIATAALVVDGGIYRHEFVAAAVIDGLMQAQMETGVPVFSGVLTPHDFTSKEREAFFKDHFVIKGKEVAQACLDTLLCYQQMGGVADIACVR